MIEQLIQELTAALKELNTTLKGQSQNATVEEHTYHAKVEHEKTTAPVEVEQEEVTESEPIPIESRHKALQQLCLKLVRADPSKKARIKTIMGEYGASLVADIPEAHLSEAERRIADLED